MKRVPYYHWRLPDELRPGRTYRARWLMTEEGAKAYPGAVKDCEQPAEYRELPETPEEAQLNDTAYITASPETREALVKRAAESLKRLRGE